MRQNRTLTCRRIRPPGRYRIDRRGSAILEFALIAPLMFALIFLFIEFDRYVVTAHALKEAARVGCRVAILDGTELEEVETQVADILRPFSINEYTMKVEPDLSTTIDGGSPVSVTIDVFYKDIGWVPTPRYLGDKTITATTTLPRER